MAPLAGCSVVLDTEIKQCRTDADCEVFGSALCDPDTSLCVARPAAPAQLDAAPAPDATPACLGPGGCYSCAPRIDPEFFAACTDSRCVPFDNRSRLRNLGPDGKLRPLP